MIAIIHSSLHGNFHIHMEEEQKSFALGENSPSND